MGKEPRDYQSEAALELFKAVNRCDGTHPIAAIPTGAGKTVVMCEFIEMCLEDDFSRKILVLSHVKDVSCWIIFCRT